MQNNTSGKDLNDPWRKAILSERSRGAHEQMIKGLEQYKGSRNHALTLGDASLVQANYLLTKAGFNMVTDVDSSPTLLDEEVISPNDRAKLKKVLSTFTDFEYPESEYDFIYGKSIAFTPKQEAAHVLKNISKSLKPGGIFSAVWAMDGDSFRKEFYTKQELESLYEETSLDIITFEEESRMTEGLVTPGKVHAALLIAKKRPSHGEAN